MKTGIELIADERREQIEKHLKDTMYDVQANGRNELSKAAGIICLNEDHYGCNELEDMVEFCPESWDEESFEKILIKPYKDRLVIAGALIAAEIDRVQALLQ